MNYSSKYAHQLQTRDRRGGVTIAMLETLWVFRGTILDIILCGALFFF